MNIILNSKAEYNRCAIPRLGLKIGSKVYKEDLKKGEEEDEMEKTIQDKIRKLRKEAQKEKKRWEGRKDRIQNPAPKRRKTDVEKSYTETRHATLATLTEEVGEKTN